MHPCVKLQVLLCALSIILVAALTVVLSLETREVILQQEVSPGERTANAGLGTRLNGSKYLVRHGREDEVH